MQTRQLAADAGVRRHPRRRWASTLGGVVLLALAVVVPTQAHASHKLLILHSGHPGDPGTTAIEMGIESVFSEHQLPPQYWVEYLDGLRFRGLNHEKLLVDLISRKYEGWRFDAIVTSGNYALDFVLDHRSTLFGDTPVVFSAVDGFNQTALREHSNVTGVSQANDFRTTLDHAFTLQPTTDEIVFITPGLLNRHLIEPLVSDYRPYIKMTFIVDDYYEDIKRSLSRISTRAVIVPLAAPLSPPGEPTMSLDEFVRRTSMSIRAPLFSVWDFLLGKGIVGGRLGSGEEQGKTAALMVLDILSGRYVDGMPPITANPSVDGFDYEMLQRFDFSVEHLADRAEIINRPVSFWRTYRELVLGTLFLIVVLSSISVALAVSHIKRRRAENELVDSEEKYRQVFSTETDAILIFDAETRDIIDVNDAALRLYGYSRVEFLSMQSTDLSAEPTLSGDSIRETQQRGFTRVSFRQHVAHDGTTFPVEISMSAFAFKGRTVIGAVVRDISDRLNFEQALKDSEQRFKDFAASAADWYWEMDENLRFSYFSDRFTDVVGVPQRNLLGKTRQETGIPGVDPDAWQQHLADLMAHRPFRNFIHPRTKPSGEVVYLAINGQPIFDSEGRFQGYRGTGSDITELKSTEEELNRYRYHLEELVTARTAALESTNRELESFSYSVSHDLRSPLRAIDGFSHALMTDHAEQLDDKALGYLERVRIASQRMGQIIDDLLELSRLTRRKMSPTELDLSQIAREVVSHLDKENPQRTVDVAIQQNVRCFGDARLLRVVIDNLVGNAWKYTTNKSHAQIEFGCREQNEKRVYYVRDNGDGFDMQYVHKLFGEFQRLHTDNQFSGTGIGLATVARIVHRHGGEVWAEGVLGQGATFSFTLNESVSIADVPPRRERAMVR